jgi:hypothetical protein
MWNVGAGNETESGTTTVRDRIKGKPYKIVLAASPSVAWSYKYSAPIYVNQLTKADGNGSIHPSDNIIIEKLQ